MKTLCLIVPDDYIAAIVIVRSRGKNGEEKLQTKTIKAEELKNTLLFEEKKSK